MSLKKLMRSKGGCSPARGSVDDSCHNLISLFKLGNWLLRGKHRSTFIEYSPAQDCDLAEM